MQIMGLRFLKPVMFCCSSKRRFLCTMLLIGAVSVTGYVLWPRADAPSGVTISSGDSVNASPEMTSAEALAEGLKMVQAAHDSFDSRISDYTATFHKQERVGGVLLPQETIFVKIRQQPFSVYLRHSAPENKAGQEAIYVDGKHDGKLVAHDGNSLLGLMTVTLPPKGFLAMRGNRHDITSAGMKNLLSQLLKLAKEQDANLARCEIRWIEDQFVDDRPCRCLEINSPERLRGFPMAIARIYFDEEYGAPVRYEAFEWPEGEGEPHLVEFYQYTNVKRNAGLSDLDFDPDNEEYDYR
ncbi:MAG: DUF1571 domain-containing protein [Pirellulales bacterium]|nr:DUF1571 domain-containing protein [Pirellulales bacterium]